MSCSPSTSDSLAIVAREWEEGEGAREGARARVSSVNSPVQLNTWRITRTFQAIALIPYCLTRLPRALSRNERELSRNH